jgi:hypothetical protein
MKNWVCLGVILLSLKLSNAQTNTLPTNGWVGIGTVNPQSELHVKGQTTFDGWLRINDASNSGGDKWGIYGWEQRLQITHRKPDWSFDSEIVNITSNGNVGIGVFIPNEKLSVNGNIRAREIKIEQSNWPDYVFTPSYKLMPLHKVEAFIKTNGHLPEVPSAKEVEGKGIEVGANQALLLKKIEELTLYMIELKKENEGLKKEMTDFKKAVQKK